MNKTFLIAGGDLRFTALAERLAENNIVFAAGFDRNAAMSEKVRIIDGTADMEEQADCLVLPLPVTSDGVTVHAPHSEKTIPLDILPSAVKEGGVVFGGMITPEVKKLFENKKVYVADYSAREEFAVLNAAATAEGAIQAAMEELPVTLSGRRILILGAGRIAKALIDMLSGFHTEITVAARKSSDLAWAKLYGCKAAHINALGDIIGDSEIIFNTVPAVILNEELLKKTASDCLIIDLASKPGGVEFDAAGMLGVKVLWLLSLPGKVAPVTSGEVIAETIGNILSERSEFDG